MAISAPSIGRLSSAGWRQIVVSPWAWCLAAVLLIAARDLAQGLSDVVGSLGDSDDALRLHEVRTLLAGKAWTDMSLPRLGGATPLISHWSRLIDLPLALLIRLFGLVMAPDKAELATRIVWPLIVLAMFLLVAVRASIRHGGRAAPLLLLVLAVTCISGLYQFHIGRIDHHNVMILGAVGGLLLLVGARLDPREGFHAGALIGLALAVGYEPLAILVPAIAGAALLAIADLRWLQGVRNMMLALAGVLTLMFLLTVAPSAWLVPRCDALSLNMVLLMAAGAAGVAIADRYGREKNLASRFAMLAAAGAVGVALYGAQDTRCLAGPFGQIDPRLGPVWLDTVVEGFNAWRVMQITPLPIVAYAVTVMFGLWAAARRWRRSRTPEAGVVLALVLISAPFGFWMIKLAPYASWIAVFSIALALADIGDSKEISAPTLQFTGVVVASQWTATLIAAQFMMALGTTPEALKGKPIYDETACLRSEAIRSLSALPKGFIVGNIDLGSYIVALTDHDALAGPYHRIDKAIIADQAILDAKPAEALALLDNVHADYLVLCLPKPGADVPGVVAGSVLSQLFAGESIGYLEPLKLDSLVKELKAWRVKR